MNNKEGNNYMQTIQDSERWFYFTKQHKRGLNPFLLVAYYFQTNIEEYPGVYLDNIVDDGEATGAIGNVLVEQNNYFKSQPRNSLFEIPPETYESNK